MAAACSATDQGVAVIDDSPLCKLLSSGDGRHVTFRVDYAAAKQPAVASRTLRTTCAIGDGGAYRCEASFRLLIGRRKLAAFAVVVSGPRYRDVHKVVVDLVLVDNARSVALQPPTRSMAIQAAAGSNQGGCGLLVSKDYLEENCVQDGVLVAVCSVLFLPELPPCLWLDSLGHRLAAMSNKRDTLTDVCFDVDGERFNAHRLVMAAQSEVFRSLLFGSDDAENKTETKKETAVVTVDGISATTFKHMLHYIYCNQLPPPATGDGDDDDDDDGEADHVTRIAELQRLLVAADAYGVEALRQACEDTLCAGINMDTVASTLALTEKGSYPKLRASCLEFLSNTQIYSVATNDECYEVVQSYPDVLTEIRDRFKKPRLTPKFPSTGTKDQNNP
ncbi:BTB/POZ and MATH domain-containing protein 2-like [Oryza glaberrima]|uniref:BTB domain-containing protein n=2 Tax=Oryza TaxID=4527 RepID=A0A0D3H5I1_9ORYZ|nr:BTB/POZ and MATH domain-containing protein 2-like [Oryza glaberrima]